MQNTSNEFYNQSQKDDIDFREFLKFIFRSKIFIFSLTSFFFFASLVFAFLRTKVWEGQFEIVLKLDKSKSDGMDNLGLDNLAKMSGIELRVEDSLNTEVGILKSPSVLKPVYELVRKDFKKRNPKNKFKTFKKWRKDNLMISLENGTTILDIKYRDENKVIIIPVLKKMAEVYQDYSGRNKRRDIELTKTFLNNQINDFQIKSIDSIRKAQNFAIDQDLTILDVNSSKLNNNLGDNIGIEVARVKAANKIREIDITIKRLIELGDETQDIQYISMMVPKLRNENLPNMLRNLDMEILEMESKFTANYKPLQTLKDKRQIFAKLLKKRAIGFLKASRISEEARMESAKRPKGVLLKYKELIRAANRDEKTLIQLENLARNLQLEEAKIEDPWQLITEPNLEEKHVSPSKKKYGLIGILLGLVSGTLLAYLKEKNLILRK
tara:strand:+ start:667 stop:1983 length:1317 start_codon:yes stop_codon:yes gene_type:complete